MESPLQCLVSTPIIHSALSTALVIWRATLGAVLRRLQSCVVSVRKEARELLSLRAGTVGLVLLSLVDAARQRVRKRG